MVHNYSVPVMSSPKTSETSPSPAPSSVGGNNMAKFGTVIPNRVFVGGISSTTTEQDLLELFSKYGTVKATKIITDRAGVSKGYGFVTFETEDEATRLTQEQADNIMLKDRKLNIAPAVKKQITEYTGFMKAYSPRLVDGAPGGVISNPAVLFANHSAAAAAAYYNQQQQHILSAVAAAANNGAMGQEYAPAHSHASYMHQQAMHSQAAAQNQAAVALAASNAGSGGSATPTQQPQYVQAGTPHQQQTFFYQPSLYYPQYQLAAAAANQQAAQSPQVYGQQIVSPSGGWQAAAGGHWRFLNQGIGGYGAGGAVPQPCGSCSTDPRSHNLSQESSSSDSCSFCSSICCLENDSSCFLDDHKAHNNSYCHTCNTHTSIDVPLTSSPTVSAAALANNPPNPSAPIGYLSPYSRGWYPTPGHHYSMVVPPFPSIFSSLPHAAHRSIGGRAPNVSQ